MFSAYQPRLFPFPPHRTPVAYPIQGTYGELYLAPPLDSLVSQLVRRARAGGALSARYRRGVLPEILEHEAALLTALESTASRP